MAKPQCRIEEYVWIGDRGGTQSEGKLQARPHEGGAGSRTYDLGTERTERRRRHASTLKAYKDRRAAGVRATGRVWTG